MQHVVAIADRLPSTTQSPTQDNTTPLATNLAAETPRRLTSLLEEYRRDPLACAALRANNLLATCERTCKGAQALMHTITRLPHSLSHSLSAMLARSPLTG